MDAHHDIFYETFPHNSKDSKRQYKDSKQQHKYYSEVFQFFGGIRSLDDYICLFLVVWNNDPDLFNALEEFYFESSVIQNAICNISSHCGNVTMDYWFAQYIQSIESRNAQLQYEIINVIIDYLHNQHNLPNSVQECLSNMDPPRRHLLRLICTFGIQSYFYLQFVNYISSTQFMPHINFMFYGSYPKIQEVQNIQNNKSEQITVLATKNNELVNETKCEKDKSLKNSIKKQSNKLSLGKTSQDDIKSMRQEIERLRQEIEYSRSEAAKYQAELGDATNCIWKDDDPNNPCRLSEEFKHLQDELFNFAKVKGGSIKIHAQAVNDLFKKYKRSITSDDPGMKSILSAVLQRHVFDFIYHEIKNYFENFSIDQPGIIPNELLEVSIKTKTDDLISLTSQFSEVNPGNDVHTRILPTKIRQQIYAALSNRGFTNPDHPLIQRIVKKLLELMDRYRTIESKEKKDRSQLKARHIVQQMMKLFYFRIYTQEQPPKLIFYENGDSFDGLSMENLAYEDPGESDVEFCAFPAVAIMVNNSDIYVLAKAKVVLQPRTDNITVLN
ncbi:4771_t:CDS:1 [Racocetra fulgida]|uniref:4771_t:CDS:1 n=1 Tax=Racocetra fulgida TaxID=60492 RepID=A0A9N8W5U7_9GLOM|nr:4771_t:CDS:1 [Racocetra fulgida]